MTLTRKEKDEAYADGVEDGQSGFSGFSNCVARRVDTDSEKYEIYLKGYGYGCANPARVDIPEKKEAKPVVEVSSSSSSDSGNSYSGYDDSYSDSTSSKKRSSSDGLGIALGLLIISVPLFIAKNLFFDSKSQEENKVRVTRVYTPEAPRQAPRHQIARRKIETPTTEGSYRSPEDEEARLAKIDYMKNSRRLNNWAEIRENYKEENAEESLPAFKFQKEKLIKII